MNEITNMHYLFFDTETTGLPKDDHDPRIVQLAALLTDKTGLQIEGMNVIIKPEGFTIPQGASDIHGITTEQAINEGIPLIEAMLNFNEMAHKADVIVAHNLAFDYPRYAREINYLGLSDLIIGKGTFCTMQASTDICKIPGSYGRYKWPKLQEAHVHFLGYEFEGAHDARFYIR